MTTIVIPTWIVIILLGLIILRTFVFIYRGALVIKGIRSVWHYAKEILDDKESDNKNYFNIKYSENINPR